jgi:hypothetical protein
MRQAEQPHIPEADLQPGGGGKAGGKALRRGAGLANPAPRRWIKCAVDQRTDIAAKLLGIPPRHRWRIQSA